MNEKWDQFSKSFCLINTPEEAVVFAELDDGERQNTLRHRKSRRKKDPFCETKIRIRAKN